MSACNGNEHTEAMFETLAVFQVTMFRLNAVAELNICEPHR